MTAISRSDGIDSQLSEPQVPYRDIVNALKGHDERWEIRQSPGNLAMERVWDNGVTDQITVLSPKFGYASRVDPDEDLMWETSATAQEVLEAVLALDVADTPPEVTKRQPAPGNWQ